jgi:hypothetical protein
VEKAFRERRSLDEFEHEGADTVGVFDDPVNGPDIRVIQCREQARLARESRETVRIRREGAGEHLDRDVALESKITGAVHFAHSA